MIGHRGMGRVLGIVGLAGVLLAAGVGAQAAPAAPDPNDVVKAGIRQACALAWVDLLCAPFAYPDPHYVPGSAEPDAAQPLALRVGVEHDHSGYSDGDPTARPSDIYAAAKSGHNVADAGGDTGVKVDFLFSSDHSENEKLPVTTAMVCLDPTIIPALACLHPLDPDHYRKWEETLAQANAATDRTGSAYTGFTALRGFEFTNDYYNHLGVYLSRNVVNAKVDGSYLTTEAFWSWLRRPANKGGGDDALVVFNHPGGLPALTPFDGDTPLNQLLDATLDGANWHSYAYVPDVDDRVSAMEVNGGDDLGWYVTALRNGWHLGAVANEDEHEREWSSTEKGKTLLLSRGRSPQDYYFALQHSRTVALGKDLVTGTPGTPAVVPSVLFWADGASVNAAGAAPLGSILHGGPHQLHLSGTGLQPGSHAVLVGPSGPPVALGTVAADGTVTGAASLAAPASGQAWRFVVICGPDSSSCGTDGLYDAVTAPIWVSAS